MRSDAPPAQRVGMVGVVAGPAGARARRTPARVLAGLAAILLATPGLALAGGAAGKPAQAQDALQGDRIAPVRTAKERLSGKAADEQRLDNCKVPLELRGPKPRPDDCGAAPERGSDGRARRAEPGDPPGRPFGERDG